MKKLAALIYTLLLYSFSVGQTDLSHSFRELYNQKKYETIIKYKPRKGEDLTAKAHYYIAMSYFMLQQDDNALKYFDIALNQGPVDHDMFFYKGKTLFYKGKYQESIPLFDKAIELFPDEPDFYGGKGESYYALNQKDEALKCFVMATSYPKCKPRIFLMAAELYNEQNDLLNAIAAYQAALPKLEKTSNEYRSTLFNIGLLNQQSGNLEEARESFEQLISVNPKDYQGMAKLIQTHYALNQIDQALPYKAKLYEAYHKKQLPETMKVMFCFDQFTWNEKKVMAFEVFDEPDDILFAKHHFYILDPNGNIEYQIDSESSVGIRMNGPQHKYVLCLVKGTSHSTYYQYVFNDDYKYNELKAAVLDILNEKTKPGASFIPRETDH